MPYGGLVSVLEQYSNNRGHIMLLNRQDAVTSHLGEHHLIEERLLVKGSRLQVSWGSVRGMFETGV